MSNNRKIKIDLKQKLRHLAVKLKTTDSTSLEKCGFDILKDGSI